MDIFEVRKEWEAKLQARHRALIEGLYGQGGKIRPELTLTEVQAKKNELNDIGTILARMESGEWGRCPRCENQMPVEILTKNPMVSCCEACSVKAPKVA